MATEKLKFTPAELKKLKPRDTAYVVQDSENKYLYCRIAPSGHKGLHVYLRVNGVPKRYPLKHLNEYKTAAQLRTDAAIEESRCRSGLSATNGRKRAKPKTTKGSYVVDTGELVDKWNQHSFKPTLGDALEYYLASKTELRESTKTAYKDKLTPAEWSDIVLEKVTYSEFEKKYKKLEATKKPSVPDNFLKAFGIMYRFADEQLQELDNEDNRRSILPVPIKKGLVKTSQANIKTAVRTNYIEPENMKYWWELTEALPEITEAGVDYRDCLQFILLNGCRKNEALKLTWADVDFRTNKVIFLDTKNHTDLMLPMSNYVRSMLKRRYKSRDDEKNESERVFKLKNLRYGLKVMNKKFDYGFMTHDLRRTFASYCVSAGVNWLVMKMMMNHAKPKDITVDYTQLESDSLLQGAQRLNDYVMSLVNAPD